MCARRAWSEALEAGPFDFGIRLQITLLRKNVNQTGLPAAPRRGRNLAMMLAAIHRRCRYSHSQNGVQTQRKRVPGVGS